VPLVFEVAGQEHAVVSGGSAPRAADRGPIQLIAASAFA
jgi:hypothetical protein